MATAAAMLRGKEAAAGGGERALSHRQRTILTYDRLLRHRLLRPRFRRPPLADLFRHFAVRRHGGVVPGGPAL